MAEKEVTVHIVDLGRSMGEKGQGRTQSNLEWAMLYVWEKITSIVALDRKTALQGVIGLRTDATNNDTGEQPGYGNISVLQGISQILLPSLKELQEEIRVNKTSNGDAISAIVIAIQMIQNYCKHLKYTKRIILVTDARGSIDGDDVPQIAEKLKSDGIELIVVGVDFDDPEYGFKEEDKDAKKAANEATLQSLVEGADGVFGTLAQAVEELGMPRIKQTRPVPSYKGSLTLGDPEKYDSAMCIDVERYPRVMIRRPATASNFVQRNVPGNRETNGGPIPSHSSDVAMADADAVESFASLQNQRTYHIVDDAKAGSKRDVKRDELAKGYEYGRTAVHISESDLNVTKLETQAGLDIIGFIPWADYERYMSMSVSCIMIAQRTNEKAIIALSSFIHALYELESYAVARLVTKVDKEPEIRLLAPSIEGEYECLLDVQIPFAEDVRPYKFPPLDRVITVSGKKITEHRHLPSDALKTAMSDYVDDMDLSRLPAEVDGEPHEYLQLTDAFSPVLHRIDQAIRWRAVHPNKPIPPPFEILTKYMNPPVEALKASEGRLQKVLAAANVKAVPPKTQARKRGRNDVKPLSGLDVSALLAPKTKKAKISSKNAIPEFRQSLDHAESADAIKDAAQQFGAVIESQIRDSLADQAYDSVIEKLAVMRQEMIEVEEPSSFNDFLTTLKTKILGEELNGDRRDMWRGIKGKNLGLVTKRESETSHVDEEHAREFLTSR